MLGTHNPSPLRGRTQNSDSLMTAMQKNDFLWAPIEDLPLDLTRLASADLPSLSAVWRDQAARLSATLSYQSFLQKLQREAAIETGVLERLYTLDRGITQLLIEQGIDAALVPHNMTDQPVPKVVSIILDQHTAIEGLFEFVKQERNLSTSYVKTLHQVLTAHQDTCDARDSLGQDVRTALVRGDFKRLPNHVRRPDGGLHEYCPPEQVASEMDQLVTWHLAHDQRKVPPEVEAAWLHHRFTQIHPFQDGNGRVARCLATLVFLRAGWFPLVLHRDDRPVYLRALETADRGDLGQLIHLFAARMKRAFVRALSLSESVLAEGANQQTILRTAIERLKQRENQKTDRLVQAASALHALAVRQLTTAAKTLGQELKHVRRSYKVKVSSAPAGHETDYYYRGQVIEHARMLDYYANMNYRSWVVMKFDVAGRTEILLHFHGVGPKESGLLCCAAMAYRRLHAGPDQEHQFGQLQTMGPDLFVFGSMEEPAVQQARFAEWLEEVKTAGLVYWQQSL